MSVLSVVSRYAVFLARIPTWALGVVPARGMLVRPLRLHCKYPCMSMISRHMILPCDAIWLVQSNNDTPDRECLMVCSNEDTRRFFVSHVLARVFHATLSYLACACLLLLFRRGRAPKAGCRSSSPELFPQSRLFSLLPTTTIGDQPAVLSLLQPALSNMSIWKSTRRFFSTRRFNRF